MADEQLAKREAERARKRELEEDEDSDDDVPKRDRAVSYDSVSTISTGGHSSPPHRRTSVTPPRPSRAARSPSPIRGHSRHSRRGSVDSVSDYDRRYSSSPEGRSRDRISPDPPSQRTRSPSRENSPRRSRFDSDEHTASRPPVNRPRGRYSQSPSRSPPRESRRQFRSRSPQGGRRPVSSPPRHNNRPAAGPPHRNNGERGGRPPREEARERSLSPFSKRLALTQAMNGGR